ncbi:MAG: hypothetical protein H0T42_01675, partial [Deltaproteobacteria bacterium]|nr:hypothetical protein [Deltaproteobacteria bacterium]
MNRAALVLALASGCTPEVITISPVIDVPFDDSGADPFSGVDQIKITIAHEGAAEEDDVLSQSFQRGQPLELAGIPFG